MEREAVEEGALVGVVDEGEVVQVREQLEDAARAEKQCQ